MNVELRAVKKVSFPPQDYPKISNIFILTSNTGGFRCYPWSSEAVFFSNGAHHWTSPEDCGFMLNIGGPRGVFAPSPGDSSHSVILYILSVLSHVLWGSAPAGSRSTEGCSSRQVLGLPSEPVAPRAISALGAHDTPADKWTLIWNFFFAFLRVVRVFSNCVFPAEWRMLINWCHSAAIHVLCTINAFLPQSGINSWLGNTLHIFGIPNFRKMREICRKYAQKKVWIPILCMGPQILLGNYGIWPVSRGPKSFDFMG